MKQLKIDKVMIPLLTGFFAFFTPVVPLLVAVGTAICLDTVTGVIKAYKRKEKITSRKFSQIAIKMLIYQLCVLTMFILDSMILGGLIESFTEVELLITKVVSVVLILIELKSINENIAVITKVNILQFFRDLLKNSRDEINSINKIKNLKK